MTTLSEVERLDAADPLAGSRSQFVVGDEPVAYLDGNSLGRLPVATAERLSRFVAGDWGGRLIRGWSESWTALPTEVGDRLAATVLGAGAGQTAVADSTTVNLYKLLHAAVGLRPGRDEILIDSANFPTDRFVVAAVAEALGMAVRWVATPADGGVTAEALSGCVGSGTAAVVLSHVDYRSGYLAPMEELTDLVHSAGGLVVWDLCHSAGAVPMSLDAADADFAVGCTYKYLNAGPGAPAFLYVASRHLPSVAQPVAGWFGAADVFAMADRHEPAPGIRCMLSGTPNVMGIVAVDSGLDAIAGAGVEAIRAKGVALTALAVTLGDELLAPLGWTLASPRDPQRRGSHVVFRGAGAAGVVERMIAAGAVPDFRRPDLVRIGLSPLTTSFREVWEGMHVMRDAVLAGA